MRKMTDKLNTHDVFWCENIDFLLLVIATLFPITCVIYPSVGLIFLLTSNRKRKISRVTGRKMCVNGSRFASAYQCADWKRRCVFSAAYLLILDIWVLLFILAEWAGKIVWKLWNNHEGLCLALSGSNLGRGKQWHSGVAEELPSELLQSWTALLFDPLSGSRVSYLLIADAVCSFDSVCLQHRWFIWTFRLSTFN